MVKHIESWDVDPARVVRSLLKPSAKVCSGHSNAGAAGLVLQACTTLTMAESALHATPQPPHPTPPPSLLLLLACPPSGAHHLCRGAVPVAA